MADRNRAAALYNNFGVGGLKLWKFACVVATMFLMSGIAETGALPAIQTIILVLAALAMMPQNSRVTSARLK
jgi:hypothetical protein